MNAMPEMEVWVEWLLRQSLQAGVLVMLVLLLQRLLRGRLTARWRFALWWLVLGRLLLPFGPESGLSLFNFLPKPSAITAKATPPLAPIPVPMAVMPAPPRASSPAISLAEPISVSSPSAAALPPIVPPEARRTVSAGAVFLVVWLTGVAGLAALVAVQSVRFGRRLRREARPADMALCDVLESCRQEMGVRRAVTLLETGAVRGPALFGLFRLRLLLPDGMAAKFSREQLRHVFLHELAHVRRGDLWLNWLVTGLQILHWFNPLLWLGFARLRADRELACDELVLTRADADTGRSYGETIIKLLEGFGRPAAIPGLVGIMEDPDQMKRRIRMIAAFRRPTRWSAWAAVLLAALGWVAWTDARTEKPVRMVLRVTDAETGTGLAGAWVLARQSFDGSPAESQELLTDAEGRVWLRASHTTNAPGTLTLHVHADGHVPKEVRWPATEVPTEHNVRLDAGREVGGVVRDGEGRPIAGVTVRTYQQGVGDTWFRERVAFHPARTTATTDVAGLWRVGHVPRDYETMRVNVEHPDYAVAMVTLNLSDETTDPPEVVLDHGTAVRGTVTDTRGQPVAGALIREAHNFLVPKRETRSGEDGSFFLGGLFTLRDEKPLIMVQSEGRAPQARALVPRTTNDLAVILAEGRILRGQVVDDSGQPLTNARVRTGTDEMGLRTVEWETRTDAEGRFEWRSAPEGTLPYWFAAEGHTVRQRVWLNADGSEHRIAMRRSTSPGNMEIVGTVTEKLSGNPVPEFRVTVGEVRPYETSPRFSRRGAVGQNGRYRLVPVPRVASSNFVVLVEADGYRPVLSTNFPTSAGSRRVDFVMELGLGPEGIVLRRDGTPVAGAEVFLFGLQGRVHMVKPGDTNLTAYDLKAQTVTTTYGRFRLPALFDSHTLVVIHEEGQAEVPVADLEKSDVVSLSAYGRVEGYLSVNGRAASGETIRLSEFRPRAGLGGRDYPALFFSQETRTDQSGRFAFENVPAGDGEIAHELKLDALKMGVVPLSQRKTISVPAGGTATVALGDVGRPVIGRMVAPGFTNVIDWRNDPHQLGTDMSNPPHLVTPRREQFDSLEAFRDARLAAQERYKAYWLSKEGIARDRARRSFMMMFEEDGSFRVNDVPPGQYQLWVRVTEPHQSSVGLNRVPNPRAVGSLMMTFTMPEVPGGHSTEPLDLGVLELKRPSPGEP